MNIHEAARSFLCDKAPRKMLTGEECELHFGPGKTGPLPHGHGYTLVYDRELEPSLAMANPKLLEIGIQSGASIRLWDWYYGRHRGPNRLIGLHAIGPWTIVGLEINLDPAVADGLHSRLDYPDFVHLEEGDSTGVLTPALPKRLKEKYGLFDVIIDDGSHWPPHQTATLQKFWPLVKPGGIYCLEDLHESWWPDGISHGSLMPLLHQLTEDCVGRGKFAEWSGVPAKDPVVKPEEEVLFCVRYYRNMVVLEKR